MSKAEELAKKYCEGSSFEDACMEKPAYIAGFHQAEKELELTWKDTKDIYFLFRAVLNEWYGHKFSDEGICQEVLKRFKTQKGEKV